MAAFALFIFGTLILGGGGIFMAKLIDQRARDRHLTSYRLAFPADMDIELPTQFLTAMSGTLREASGADGCRDHSL